jgi:hypothetical protein
VCKDYVRKKLGLAPFQPNGNGRSRASEAAIDQALRVAFAAQQGHAGATVVATYDYRDELGTLLYQVVRLQPKSFRHRKPNGNGGWVWQGNERRVPYRWPELIEYPDGTVFVTEGEKDADRVAGLGHCATTVASGEWTVDCVKALAGRDCLILEDNDQAGRKKAHETATSLYGTAKSIRIVHLPDLPDKGDVSDWLDADPRRADKLIDICFDAPVWNPDSATMAVPQPTVDACDEGAVKNHTETATEPESSEISNCREDRPWPVLDDAALHGLAGDVVKALDPHAEADPVSILVQFLTTFGNIIGNNAYYLVESDQHHANLFSVQVGASAKGRKGTAGGRVKAITRFADETWSEERTASGLSSGEGLINAVRDAVVKWDTKSKQFETADPGVADKRLMVIEPEFAGALSAMERHGNTLSPVIRNAWDGKKLQTLTKASPLKATGAHVSITAHITEAEARARLSRTEMANGFANRFLFCCVKRSKLLPHGGHLNDGVLAALSLRFKEAVDFARQVGRVKMTEEAGEAWTAAYPELSAERPGLVGAVIARAEAQVIRLSLIFALLDEKDEIAFELLEAAMAVWAYCEASALRIFGDSLGDPVADDILRALRQRGGNGMTRTDLYNLFGRHRASDQIGAALQLLATKGKIRSETRETSGRPSETFFAIRGDRA